MSSTYSMKVRKLRVTSNEAYVLCFLLIYWFLISHVLYSRVKGLWCFETHSPTFQLVGMCQFCCCGGLYSVPWQAQNCLHASLKHIRWFYGDAALLLIFAGVCEAGLSGPGRSDDPGFGHQGVGQRGLPVIHVGNHRHVSDVGLFVHDGPDLIHSEVHLSGVGWVGVNTSSSRSSF